MKVIIIKNCKDGKLNQVIDVSDGYATNFLIKKGFALPVNSKTQNMLDNRLEAKAASDKAALDAALNLKARIESLTAHYKLKVTNNVIHGSITRKQIQEFLREHKISIDNPLVENVKIASLGISKVKIELHKDVTAILKVEVKEDGK